MAKDFFVVGGEYADTSFSNIADGLTEERYGPFTEKDAHDFWRGITAKTVDNALVRYVIRREGDQGGREWFVVGGEWADTSFGRIAPDHRLEVYGPLDRAEAMSFWRGITAKSVDNALARYDVVTGDEVEHLKITAVG
ncbi:MAG: DUF4170 domain-containing protein [Alphaproteobacteria bacterium]|nr:DUF4170 domain-containing protein [Alphaproteobacteria bacterium]